MASPSASPAIDEKAEQRKRQNLINLDKAREARKRAREEKPKFETVPLTTARQPLVSKLHEPLPPHREQEEEWFSREQAPIYVYEPKPKKKRLKLDKRLSSDQKTTPVPHVYGTFATLGYTILSLAVAATVPIIVSVMQDGIKSAVGPPDPRKERPSSSAPDPNLFLGQHVFV